MTTISNYYTRLLTFVHEYTVEHGQAPTLKEMSTGCDISTPSLAEYRIAILTAQGYLVEAGRSPRGYRTARFLKLTDAGLNLIGIEPKRCEHCGSLYFQRQKQ